MTFWDFLDRRWPGERGWAVILLAVLIASLLKMADNDPDLWKVELFKTLLTATIVTGALNMILPFHFSANLGDEEKTANTARAFDAIRTASRGDSAENVIHEGDTVRINGADGDDSETAA